jgi:hypothetical protein
MGPVVIRTVWLGVALLVCLIGLASFKLAFGAPRPMAVVQASAAAAGRDMPEIGTSPVSQTLTKGDRLPVTYIRTVEPLATELQVPPEPTSISAPKIIGRHWHDPSDPRAAQGGTKKPKSKDLKKHARRVERKPSAPEACNPDGSGPLRRLFGSTTTCSKMRMVTTP